MVDYHQPQPALSLCHGDTCGVPECPSVRSPLQLKFVIHIDTPSEKKNEKSQPKACITDILTMKLDAQERFTDSVIKSAQLKLKEQELIKELNAL